MNDVDSQVIRQVLKLAGVIFVIDAYQTHKLYWHIYWKNYKHA